MQCWGNQRAYFFQRPISIFLFVVPKETVIGTLQWLCRVRSSALLDKYHKAFVLLIKGPSEPCFLRGLYYYDVRLTRDILWNSQYNLNLYSFNQHCQVHTECRGLPPQLLYLQQGSSKHVWILGGPFATSTQVQESFLSGSERSWVSSQHQLIRIYESLGVLSEVHRVLLFPTTYLCEPELEAKQHIRIHCCAEANVRIH